MNCCDGIGEPVKRCVFDPVIRCAVVGELMNCCDDVRDQMNCCDGVSGTVNRFVGDPVNHSVVFGDLMN
jgi:hypothetical protein